MFTEISKSELFGGRSAEQVEALFVGIDYQVKECSEGDMVAMGGTRCHSMMILFQGKVNCESPRSGALVETISAPALVAPAFLYSSDNLLPVTVVAQSSARIMVIPRAGFSKLLAKDVVVLENFMFLLSDRNKAMGGKMLYFGFKNIKSKFANLLLEQSQTENSLNLRLAHSQREMAEMFGVTRPALARAIGEMAAEGAITVDHKNITIVYREKLKQYATK